MGGGPFLGGAELTFIWKSFHIGKCKTFRLAKSDEWERWGNLMKMVVKSRVMQKCRLKFLDLSSVRAGETSSAVGC